MKALHRPGLFAWSQFDEQRNIDFNGTAWCGPWAGPQGNVLVDPMPLSAHDLAHLEALGGAVWIVLTNADHARDSARLASHFGASIAAPAAERGAPEYEGLAVTRWFEPGEMLQGGLRVIGMPGSKTPGEVAFLLPEGDTLITGDLIRGHADLDRQPRRGAVEAEGQAQAGRGRAAVPPGAGGAGGDARHGPQAHAGHGRQPRRAAR